MAVGMIASCVISVYLFISPPKFSMDDEEEELTTSESVKRV